MGQAIYHTRLHSPDINIPDNIRLIKRWWMLESVVELKSFNRSEWTDGALNIALDAVAALWAPVPLEDIMCNIMDENRDTLGQVYVEKVLLPI